MAFSRRGKRPGYTPPSPPPPEEVRRAEEQLQEAETALSEVKERDPEITERAEQLDRVHKVNHIGPRFWEAVGIRREKRA